MNRRFIASLIIALPWVLFAIMGLGNLNDIQMRHLPDQPSVLQIGYYVVIPTITCLASLTGAVTAFKSRSRLATAMGGILAFGFFPYLLLLLVLSGGGI